MATDNEREAKNAYQRAYRATQEGRARTRRQGKAQYYALSKLKLAHPREYERYRQEYLATHPA
jgi:hypothetical protein